MPERWPPRPHDRIGVRWLVSHPAAGLLIDLGMGKTAIALAAFQALRRSGGARKALVVAPRNPALEVWSHRGEVGKWSDFADLRVATLHGPAKTEALETDADLYVTTPEGLQWLAPEKGPKPLRRLFERGVDTLIVDELSKFKNPRALRSKLLRPWLQHFRRRWGLTGSPASNHLLDLFGQVYVLDLGQALGRYLTHYRARYFDPSGYGGYDWQVREGAEERIYEALRGICLSMRADDHLDLPPLVEVDRFVVLPAKARRAYDDLEEELITELEAGTVTAASAGVATQKCRQIASGGLYYERDGRRITAAIHHAKTEALVDCVEELQGQPLLVCYEFQHDLERIRGALGDVPAINGQSTPKQTAAAIDAWNAGELPVLCGHPAAMAHGLNLQRGGSHLLWYSLTWSRELYEQAIGRLRRPGTAAQRILVHRLLARDTVDEAVAGSLASKARTQGALLDALKAYVRGRRKAAR